MPSPALQLDLHLDGADTFGALEWVLANARRTGLSLQRIQMEDGRTARLVTEARDADLLQLFLHRVSQGVDVHVLDAEFLLDSEPEIALAA